MFSNMRIVFKRYITLFIAFIFTIIGIVSCICMMLKVLHVIKEDSKTSKHRFVSPSLDNVYVNDVFLTRDNELSVIFIKDMRNNEKIEVTIGERTYYISKMECDFFTCYPEKMWSQCSFTPFYATLKFNPWDLNGNYITVNARGRIPQSFKIIDARNSDVYEHELAVLIKPLFYAGDWQNIVQFFEHWLSYGATKFYVYQYSWSQQVDQVMKFYQLKLGDGLEIIPWSAFPVRETDKANFTTDPNTRLFDTAALASFHNALYRAKQTARFLAVTDLDEIFYLKKGDNVVTFLNTLKNNNPDAATFIFKWIHVGVEASLKKLEKPSELDFQYLRELQRATENSLPSHYKFLGKGIHLTSRVDLLDYHIPMITKKNPRTNKKYKTVKVPKEFAVVLHIRRIYDAGTLTNRKEEIREDFVSTLEENWLRRINATIFSDTKLAPWYTSDQLTLATLHDCRRISYLETSTQCSSIRTCELYLQNMNSFVFAKNSWTDVALRTHPLSDIFPAKNDEGY